MITPTTEKALYKKSKEFFLCLDFKVAKSETLAPAPDCSGNPFADFSCLSGRQEKSAKDWNGKRGGTVAKSDKIARPKK